jgi:voltage-gated sodium channel
LLSDASPALPEWAQAQSDKVEDSMYTSPDGENLSIKLTEDVESKFGEEQAIGRGKQAMSRSKGVDQLLFPPANATTLTVQKHLSRPLPTLEDSYRKEGIFQEWARSKWFESISLIVILLNTIWIAVDTDYNTQEVLCNAAIQFQIADNFFCIFFCIELFIRIMAYKKRRQALKDPMFVFDLFMVSLMVWDTWIKTLLYSLLGDDSFTYGRAATIFRIFRIARLTRVARTGKLLRGAPELMILAKAMVLALRSVVAILVMLILVIYVFAILFTQLLADCAVATGKFENVPQSMNFLMIQLLCGFDSEFMVSLVGAGLMYYFTFLLFLLLANLTIMNMLIGILCDVVAEVAASEKEDNFTKEIEAHLEAFAAKIDSDGDKRVSRIEFINMMQDYSLVEALNEAGVDVVSFVEYASFVFDDGANLCCEDFLNLIAQFRGNRVATVKELVNTRKYVTSLFESMQVHIPK